MASLFEPVGPLDRRVYWRRRLVILGGALIVLLILLKACTGGDGGSTPAGSASPAASPSLSSSPSPSGSSSKSPTASPSASATKTTKPITNCKDSDVLVTAKPAKSSYAVGDTVSIKYVVTTKGDVPCKRDVGGAADEVRVVSGSTVIWSSDYCSPGGKKDVRTIGPDDAFSVVVDWDGNVASSDCPSDRLPAPAGVYQVVGRNGSVFGPSSKLTLG